MDAPVIQVREFRKVYRGFVAVDGISFDVHRGEVFGLLGPNGAGKTTTLESLGGVAAAGRRHAAGRRCRPDARGAPAQRADRGAAAGIRPARQFPRRRGHALLLRVPRDRAAAGSPRPGRPGRPERRAAPRTVRRAAAAAGPGPGRGPRPGRAHPRRADLRPGRGVTDHAARAHPGAAGCRHHGAPGHARHGGGIRAGDQGGDPAPRGDRGDGDAAGTAAAGGGHTRVSVRTEHDSLGRPGAVFPAVSRSSRRGDYTVYFSTDVGPTVSAVIAYLAAQSDPLVDLRVERPSLEDPFLEITTEGATR